MRGELLCCKNMLRTARRSGSGKLLMLARERAIGTERSWKTKTIIPRRLKRQSANLSNTVFKGETAMLEENNPSGVPTREIHRTLLRTTHEGRRWREYTNLTQLRGRLEEVRHGQA